MPIEFSFTVEGTHQGKFKGESPKDKHKEQIVGLAFSYTVTLPFDLTTGQATGQRQHIPITVTKEWGACTPQLFQALFTNETLKEVHFDFRKTVGNDEGTLFHTVKLSNARVVAIRQVTRSHEGSGGAQPEPAKYLEEISFTFERIEIDNKSGKTAASDDWHHAV